MSNVGITVKAMAILLDASEECNFPRMCGQPKVDFSTPIFYNEFLGGFRGTICFMERLFIDRRDIYFSFHRY